MEWPRETTMLTLFGLYSGERLTIEGRLLWLSAGEVVDAYLVPHWATDELLARGWARFAGDEWDSPLGPTDKGLYWLEKWFKAKYPATRGKTMPQIARDHMMKPMKRILVTA